MGGRWVWETEIGIKRLRLGTLESPFQYSHAYHIHTASKVDWEVIADGLPQYPGAPILTPQQASAWLHKSKEDFGDKVRDPWA